MFPEITIFEGKEHLVNIRRIIKKTRNGYEIKYKIGFD